MIPTTTNVDAVVARAYEVGRSGPAGGTAAEGIPDPAADLLDAAGGNRVVVEQARDRLAARVHTRVDDYEATAALQILNRALSRLPISDPLDWKVRWSQRFRRP